MVGYLVRTTYLHRAGVMLVKVVEVVALQQLVAEFSEGDT
jgi:hypothetical protein